MYVHHHAGIQKFQNLMSNRQHIETVLKLTTLALVTVCLTRISDESIFSMYPWPTVVRQNAAYTSLGIVGRSFTY
jgi:hypothetical protein